MNKNTKNNNSEVIIISILRKREFGMKKQRWNTGTFLNN
jgi:hypothetical protein